MIHLALAPRSITFALLAMVFSTAVHAQAQAGLPPKIKRVVFLGDSITYLGQYTAYVEAYFKTRYPARTIEFINVGLPSETVSGLSEPGHAGGTFPRPDLKERLARVLAATKPDLVFACYGMNDGIYLPFDEKRFADFQTGMKHMHDAVKAANSEIIHLTPPFFDGTKTKNLAYQDTLDHYSKWLLDQRNQQHWVVFDVHGPMTDFINENREIDPNFVYAADGVHPNDLGHWIIAKQILLGLGAKDITNATTAQDMMTGVPHGEEILKLVQRREDMLKDAWLTSTKHLRPGMKQGLPLPEAHEKAAEIEKEIRNLH
ncbi:MAG: SGNH/GDSL hydrolase family protein [Luteolibacter sp.]